LEIEYGKHHFKGILIHTALLHSTWISRREWERVRAKISRLRPYSSKGLTQRLGVEVVDAAAAQLARIIRRLPLALIIRRILSLTNATHLDDRKQAAMVAVQSNGVQV